MECFHAVSYRRSELLGLGYPGSVYGSVIRHVCRGGYDLTEEGLGQIFYDPKTLLHQRFIADTATYHIVFFQTSFVIERVE